MRRRAILFVALLGFLAFGVLLDRARTTAPHLRTGAPVSRRTEPRVETGSGADELVLLIGGYHDPKPGRDRRGSLSPSRRLAPPGPKEAPPRLRPDPGPAAAPARTVPRPSPTPPTSLSYRVESGDTLSSIASEMLGNARLWTQIAEANGIEDPRELREGMDLIIPLPAGSGATGSTP